MWSLAPELLDRQALVACWREALLAQAVLLGRTRGYTNHPQLIRFKLQADPAAAVGAYLRGIRLEADRRGYSFDDSRIERVAPDVNIDVTTDQLAFEWTHLQAKLAVRSIDWLPVATARVHESVTQGRPLPVHPIFTAVPGGVEPWERAA
ncbi:pyrimidine dimer DNA glycosylase/endonuclease V [Rarobacter faecitabidus]